MAKSGGEGSTSGGSIEFDAIRSPPLQYITKCTAKGGGGRTDLEHKMSLTGNCSKQLFDISFVATLWKNMVSKKVSDVKLVTSITCT